MHQYGQPAAPHPGHLAWHETLELHELIAFQSSSLIAFKKNMGEVHDPALRTLYGEAIHGVETNLQELLRFIPAAPAPVQQRNQDMNAFFAGNLLGFAKTSVRNYAIAITETATPQLRDTLQRQLHKAIQLHGKVFHYMYQRSYYPAYNLSELLAGDVKKAQKAIAMK